VTDLITIFLRTPYWVWVILTFIVIRGVRALYNRTDYLYRFGIMPTILIFWSMVSLFHKTGLSLAVWIAFWLVGWGVGYLMMHALRITVHKDSGLIHVPGTVIPLIISASFFIIKYCLGITYLLYPALQASAPFTAFDSGLSGVISGISLGRFMYIVRKYYTVTRF